MSFQAYIDNITKATHHTPDQIKDIAMSEGLLTQNLTATIFCDWLAKKFNLGRGHSMALWKLFIDKQWIITKHTTLK